MPSFPLGSSQAVSHPNPSSYAPLADETNHDHKSMNSASNGTIVYAKRLPSSSSTRSGGSAGSSSDTHQANPFRSESEETLSVPNGRDRKGKGREILRVDVNGFDDGDLGNVRAIPRQNGAGRDLEQGRTEDVYESYPPLNEEEEEERRIQAVSRGLSNFADLRTSPALQLRIKRVVELAPRGSCILPDHPPRHPPRLPLCVALSPSSPRYQVAIPASSYLPCSPNRAIAWSA